MSEKYIYAALSEQGYRENNEDLCHVQSLADDSYLLAVVCDGVGGEQAGEVASYIAVKVLSDFLSGYSEIDLDILRRGVIAANNAIIEMQLNPRYDRMCTCMSACILSYKTDKLLISHIGDTRIYSYATMSDVITKLTRDHSYVGEKLDRDEISERQAMSHPKRNRITRCLGSRSLSYDDDYIYAAEYSLKDIDSLILISDGVYDAVSSAEIKDIIATVHPPETAARSIVDEAIANKSRDNISVIVIRKILDLNR